MDKLIPAFLVDDVAGTADFYSDVLGFEVVSFSGSGDAQAALLRCGAVELIFRSVDSVSAPHSAYLTLHIYIDDAPSLYENVVGQADVIRELAQTLFAAGEFWIRDINGMTLHFVQSQPGANAGAPPPPAG